MKRDPVKSSFRFNIYLIMDIISSFKTLNIPLQTLKAFCKDNYLNNQKIKKKL